MELHFHPDPARKLCLQWKTPDDGEMNCPKHVEFHSKNKFEKLVHLVGFIIRNLSRCMVT
jgi:hypothetical protein